MTKKREPEGASWRDVVRWMWDVFGATIKTAVGPAVVSGGLIAVARWEFVTSSHIVPGWTVVAAAGVFGLCVVSVGLHVYRWWRRRSHRYLSIEHKGPQALRWQMGKRGDTRVMMPCGDFLIVNRIAGKIGVPRSLLVVSYRRWRFFPARRYVEGFGLFEPLGSHLGREERLLWEIEPTVLKEGDTLVARVCLIDHDGGENWTRWLRWPYRG